MTLFTKTLLLVAGLSLAACTNPNRFGAGTNDSFSDAGSFADPAQADPSSPAYFSTTIGDRVLFEVDQTTLTAEARSILTAQAGWLNTNTAYLVKIEGHADERGTTEYNLGLSNTRASAVKEFLISQGVAGSRISVAGFGKERPIEICSEEVCYAKNRRAVTVLVGGIS